MNTTKVDLNKYKDATIASGEEAMKWRKIKIGIQIALLFILLYSWYINSWGLAILGVITCLAIGKYANSKMNKAFEEFIDNANRSSGMAEGLVQAKRNKRTAEKELNEAINNLDRASSSLSEAKTFEEKQKAESNIISAQADIERAKFRLQKAIELENLESQKTNKQTTEINKFSQTAKDVIFDGEMDLNNDSYKIYLVKKYEIEKNNALEKFICKDRLFDSIIEALEYADKQENSDNKNSVIFENNQIANQNSNDILTKEKNIKIKNKNYLTIVITVITILFSLIIVNENTQFFQRINQTNFKQSPKSEVTSSNLTPNPTNKSYFEYRKEILNSGWSPYIRKNEFTDIKRDYPEMQFCFEDDCQTAFINVDKNKVRIVHYQICSIDRYYQCTGKPREFEKVYKNIIVSKTKSDEDFARIKKQLEN
jgi:hypothetical protein